MSAFGFRARVAGLGLRVYGLSSAQFMMAATVVCRHDSFEDKCLLCVVYNKHNKYNPREILSALFAGLSTILQVADSGD